MALRDVAAALAANWDDTLPQLESGDLQLIGAAIAAMAAAKENEQAANAASAELTTLLLVRLPAGHPVRDAIASGTRFLGSSADLARIAVELGALPGLNVGSVPPLSAPAGMADALDPGPGGVADGWLGGNAWLNAVPAHVLGRVDDELLTRAAQAEFPEG